MKVAVLGAGGKGGLGNYQGSCVSRGHEVVAVGRNPDKLPTAAPASPRPRATLLPPTTLAGPSSKGADAVIERGFTSMSPSATLASARVKKAGVDRLLVMGGAASLKNAEGTDVEMQRADSPRRRP